MCCLILSHCLDGAVCGPLQFVHLLFVRYSIDAQPGLACVVIVGCVYVKVVSVCFSLVVFYVR